MPQGIRGTNGSLFIEVGQRFTHLRHLNVVPLSNVVIFFSWMPLSHQSLFVVCWKSLHSWYYFSNFSTSHSFFQFTFWVRVWTEPILLKVWYINFSWIWFFFFHLKGKQICYLTCHFFKCIKYILNRKSILPTLNSSHLFLHSHWRHTDQQQSFISQFSLFPNLLCPLYSDHWSSTSIKHSEANTLFFTAEE